MTLTFIAFALKILTLTAGIRYEQGAFVCFSGYRPHKFCPPGAWSFAHLKSSHDQPSRDQQCFYRTSRQTCPALPRLEQMGHGISLSDLLQMESLNMEGGSVWKSYLDQVVPPRRIPWAKGKKGKKMNMKQKNILIAMDGSDQSPETVRYVGNLFPEGRAKITLFHIMDLLPENLADYRSGPDLRYEVSGVRQWAFDQMGRIEVFMEQAIRLLSSMGYRKEDITVIVRDRISDILQDLAQEGLRRGYDAVVAGYSTVALIKDLPLENFSEKLVALLSRLPVWIVGGSPDTSKILIALDNSREARTRRVLDYVADLFPNIPYPEFLLLYVSSKMGRPEPEFGELRSVKESSDWRERVESDFRAGEYGMESYFRECMAEMERKGIDRNRVKTKVIDESASRSEAIMREALDGGYGTVVLGRRKLSRIDEVIRGRVSSKVMELATKNAVWVVN